MGEVPEWYRVIKAAKYLGVSPWDLADQSIYWVSAAEAAQEVDALAEKIAQEQAEKDKGTRKG